MNFVIYPTLILKIKFIFTCIMKKRKIFIYQSGQALLTLLFFMIIGISITSATAVMILVNSRSGSFQQQGEVAYQIAQSGAENAMLRILRNPSYTGETLTVGGGTATVVVTGSGTGADPYVIVSTGTLGTFVRKVQVQATYVNNLLQVTSQKEVF